MDLIGGSGALALLALLVVAVVVASWLSWTAGRLDRMHLRVDGARSALEAALARRRALAIELATGDLLDPASAMLLADAAARPPAADGGTGHPRQPETWQRESDLSAVLRAIAAEQEVTSTVPRELWSELSVVTERVSTARRIHNDLVATTLELRARRRVRWFRLTGHAPPVAMVAFDDEPPPT